MDLNDFNQTKYLAGRELPDPDNGSALTIAGFEVVKLGDGSSKPVMRFREAGFKPMLLNRTNRQRLEVIFRTSDTAGLVGQRVNVFFDRMVQGPNGDLVGGLRLRPLPAAQPLQFGPVKPTIPPPVPRPASPLAATPQEAFNDDFPF